MNIYMYHVLIAGNLIANSCIGHPVHDPGRLDLQENENVPIKLLNT